ncbi:ADP-dependent glucokinase [Callorhinchus milii]|uniref:ADP-dependent glucokinase n=2 Tax=Callorhinchus milii TaxID=7868 RepID=V9KRD3_CALMI|nr:ADP-dependent glucokinase [Callorhinchus milii]|eukprot:gi/632952857/ref/XP_007892085.1/ PREDICTED: ADP-dependent glucokinase-like [Callorhinchus milii]
MAPGLRFGAAFSLLVVLAAYWYRQQVQDELDGRLETVLSSLLKAESKVDLEQRPRVAVGFGGCLDIVADGVALLNKAGVRPSNKPIHHNDIKTEEHLAESFAYFFRPGAASERFVSNITLFRQLVKATQSLPRVRWSLGGNAPVMANRLAIEGCEVLMGSRLTSDLVDVLQEHVTVTSKAVDEMDIHLILEYSSGSKWGELMSQRANRFILHSDSSNPMLESLEDFEAQLLEFNPALLVVSGLQMMDNFPFKQGQSEERLKALQSLMLSVDRTTGIHFEMASFVNEDLLKSLFTYIVPYADSLGMNEQELPNLLSMVKGGNITLLSDPYPRVACVLDQMRELYHILNSQEVTFGQRKLTRLHVHTLAFQAIIVAKGSAWKNTMSATAKASLTANRHVCGSPHIDTSKAKLIMDDSFSVSRELGSKKIPLQENRPVSCWEENDYEICVAPVLVCTEVYQTVGGGDNISAASLVLQI